MKNIKYHFITILLSIFLLFSFFGECSGFHITDDDGSGGINDDSNNELDPPIDEPDLDNPIDDQESDTSNLPNDSVYDPSTDSNSNNADNIENNNDTLTEESLPNWLENTINDYISNNDVTDNSESTINRLNSGIVVNYDNLDYWLEKFKLTNLDDELRARFFELAKKSNFLYEIKLKIMQLLSDNNLNEQELRDKLLNFIRTASYNEREVPVDEIAYKVEQQYGTVLKGIMTQVLMDGLKEDTVIERVQFISKRDLSEVKVSVIKLKQRPENIPLSLRENENVYNYLDIKLTDQDEYISDEDIESLNFTFNVEVSWITEANIDKNTVVLIRYHDGEWQNLTTNLLSENETHIIFEAETPGCSTFAVVGSSLVEIPEPYVTESPDIPWTIILGIISSTTILLGFILVKARYIYIGDDNKKKM